MPARVVEKGQLGNSAVVELIIAKFCDHLPIYRQMRIWERDHGLVLDEALAGRHVLAAGRLLEPLARFFGQKLKEGEFIQADETRVSVLQQKARGAMIPHGSGNTPNQEAWSISIQIRQQALPASQLAKACDYLLTQWKRFCVFAADGLVEIDNNWCEPERSGDGPPLGCPQGERSESKRDASRRHGRKNWMPLGTQHSGPPVAAIMTVLASAQRASINIRLYLAHCLEKLADRSFTTDPIHTLLPEHWKPQTP